MTELKLIHDPDKGPLKIIGLMSGSGSNLRKILEKEQELKEKKGKFLYKIVAVFSDTYHSKACELGKEFDIPVIVRDITSYYAKRGKSRKDLKVREEYDLETIKALAPFKADIAVYAGYMSIASRPLVEAYLGINVHPADLSIKENGKRKYIGAHAVREAILAGETSLRSSIHIIEPLVDEGRLLMLSPPVPVIIDKTLNFNDPQIIRRVSEEHQERLKKQGDWIAFPKTLQYIAEGKFAQDGEGKLYFDNIPIPNGVILE